MILFKIKYLRYNDLEMSIGAAVLLFVFSIVFGIAFRSFFVGLFCFIATILYSVLVWIIMEKQDKAVRAARGG
jgi:predicted Co/Zn/Cd cation transporter (cation efflux family)